MCTKKTKRLNSTSSSLPCQSLTRIHKRILTEHDDREETKLLNKSLFSLKNIYIYRDFYYLSGPCLKVLVALLSMQGQKALRFNKKYINLCFPNMNKGLTGLE